MIKKIRYYVYYGDCSSKQDCYTVEDVQHFIAYCLREGTKINSVCKA